MRPPSSQHFMAIRLMSVFLFAGVMQVRAESCVICSPIKPVSITSEPYAEVASTSIDDIIAAVNRIKAAGGGTLYFPAGRYEITRDERSPYRLSP